MPDAVADGEWWRLFTAGFLHIGPLHIAFNMCALWVLGRDLEIVLGRARFLALYIVSLLGGSTAVVLFADPQQYVAGASGAVFGLMSGLLLVLLRLRRPYGPVVALIVLNLVISQVVPGISIAGHVGGLVVGAVASAALVFAPARQRTVVQVRRAGRCSPPCSLPRSRCTSSDSRPDPTAARLARSGRDVLRVGVQVEPAEDVEALGAVGGDRVELQQRALATQPAHAQHPHTLHERPRVVAVAQHTADGDPVGVRTQPRSGAGTEERGEPGADRGDGRDQPARRIGRT